MTMSRALVRLFSLLAVAVGLIGLAPSAIVLLATVLAVWIILMERDLIAQLGQRIWRMRWFFLAIAILYGLGSPLADPWSGWLEGAYRVAILIVLVITVAVCLHRLPAHELADGIATLLAPLRYLRIPVDTFARRTAATLDAVNDMSERVRALPRGRSALGGVAQICEQAERYTVLENLQLERPAPAPRDLAFLALMLVLLVMLRLLA